jgi:sulfate adenylyltransferase
MPMFDELCSIVLTDEQPLLTLKTLTLTKRQLCDLELLMNGGFYPLQGFLGQADYQCVLQEMRLANGALWPMPITLDVSEAFAASLNPGERICLENSEGVPLAVLQFEESWLVDKEQEAECIYQSQDESHPGVHYLFQQTHPVYISGRLQGLNLPTHYDFIAYRKTPKQLKELFKNLGWTKIVAFQTRNPMHRAHYELTRRAAVQSDANILLHPVVGLTQAKDIDYVLRVRCYEKILAYYPPKLAYLSLLPLAMRMAGPREALWHALIRKNYGCTHFIVGRDHAGLGKNKQDQWVYPPYAAQDLCEKFEDEMGIKTVSLQEMVYVKNTMTYQSTQELQADDEALSISGSELRQCLQTGADIPAWFSFPEIIDELKAFYPAKHQQGFTLFFTGLSGSGKSTLAQAVMARLLEFGRRQVTLLDGDQVRKHLSSELGFSKEHRDLNIMRMSFVAQEINKHRGIALCAPIAPYAATRKAARELISQQGAFIEIYLATPLSICEARDRKGLYAKARAGLLPGFTGIDAPYEAPESPEIMINTALLSVDECVNMIMDKLFHWGYFIT